MFVSIAAGKTHLRVPFLSMLEGKKEAVGWREEGRLVGWILMCIHTSCKVASNFFQPIYASMNWTLTLDFCPFSGKVM